MGACGFAGVIDMDRTKRASEILLSHVAQGTTLDTLPDDLRPTTRADGYAIQAHIQDHGHTLRGWKIAATSIAGQKHINVDGPLAGRLMANMVHPDGAIVPFANNRMRVAEAEFVFDFAIDLKPRSALYSQKDVMAAVGDLYLGIEIPDSRFGDFVSAGGAQLIADNACANHFVLGPKAPDLWRDINLAQHTATAEVIGKRVAHGIGSNVLDDPRIALTWIVNELTALGVTLHAGEFVTTGTCIVPIVIDAGDQVVVDFGTLGRVSCYLSRD